jgi:hypothetical protein
VIRRTLMEDGLPGKNIREEIYRHPPASLREALRAGINTD